MLTEAGVRQMADDARAGRWEEMLNARQKAPGCPPVCRACASAVPDSARDCDECGDVIGYDGAVEYGDGTIRHHPRCDEAMRARLNARRGEGGRFVR